MSKRKVYIDKEQISSKEIIQARDFDKLLKRFKAIRPPFYTKTSFLLSSVAGVVAITSAILYFNNPTVSHSGQISTKEINVRKIKGEKDADKQTPEQESPGAGKLAWKSLNTTEADKANRSQRVVSGQVKAAGASVQIRKESKDSPVLSKVNSGNSEQYNARINEQRSIEPLASWSASTLVTTNPDQSKHVTETSGKDSLLSGQTFQPPVNNPEKAPDSALAVEPLKPDTTNSIQNVTAQNQTMDSVKKDSINPIQKDSVKKENLTDTSHTEKSFRKKLWVLDGGVNLGVYTDQVSNVEGQVKKSMAASAIYAVGAEYGIVNRLGLGGRISVDDFFTGTDSTTHKKQRASGFNMSVFVNYHLVRTRRFDLPIGFSTGLSGFTYSANDMDGTKASGAGLITNLYVCPRFYFGKHVGIFTDFSLTGFNYNSLNVTYSNFDPNPLTGTASKNTISFNLSGFTLGFGVQWKF